MPQGPKRLGVKRQSPKAYYLQPINAIVASCIPLEVLSLATVVKIDSMYDATTILMIPRLVFTISFVANVPATKEVRI